MAYNDKSNECYKIKQNYNFITRLMFAKQRLVAES